MRRKDDEIRNIARIEAILQAADVCRVAFSENDYPYIVPVCFGYERGRLYFHSAPEGKKIDLLRKNPRCCFEVETGIVAVPAEMACNWGMRYQSVIGTGTAHLIEDPGEKRHGLTSIVAHYSGNSGIISEPALKTSLLSG